MLDHKATPKREPTGGTSFAAPSILRMGAGIRAHLGPSLGPLAIRALLVHCADPRARRTFEGMVRVTATLCYATEVDPHHPGNYTRAGLEATFRPSKDVKRDKAMHAKSRSFFGKDRATALEPHLEVSPSPLECEKIFLLLLIAGLEFVLGITDLERRRTRNCKQ